VFALSKIQQAVCNTACTYIAMTGLERHFTGSNVATTQVNSHRQCLRHCLYRRPGGPMSGPDTAVKTDMQLSSGTKTSHTAECQVTNLKRVSYRGENDFEVLENATLKKLLATR
jgi:hypothetical protein